MHQGSSDTFLAGQKAEDTHRNAAETWLPVTQTNALHWRVARSHAPFALTPPPPPRSRCGHSRAPLCSHRHPARRPSSGGHGGSAPPRHSSLSRHSAALAAAPPRSRHAPPCYPLGSPHRADGAGVWRRPPGGQSRCRDFCARLVSRPHQADRLGAQRRRPPAPAAPPAGRPATKATRTHHSDVRGRPTPHVASPQPESYSRRGAPRSAPPGDARHRPAAPVHSRQRPLSVFGGYAVTSRVAAGRSKPCTRSSVPLAR